MASPFRQKESSGQANLYGYVNKNLSQINIQQNESHLDFKNSQNPFMSGRNERSEERKLDGAADSSRQALNETRVGFGNFSDYNIETNKNQ